MTESKGSKFYYEGRTLKLIFGTEHLIVEYRYIHAIHYLIQKKDKRGTKGRERRCKQSTENTERINP